MPTVGRERNSGVGVGNANHLCLHGPSARDIEDEHILIGAVEVRCFEVAVGVITAGQYSIERRSAHGETYRTISREVRVIPQSRAQGHERRAGAAVGVSSWPVGSSVALGRPLGSCTLLRASSPTSLSRSTVRMPRS